MAFPTTAGAAASGDALLSEPEYIRVDGARTASPEPDEYQRTSDVRLYEHLDFISIQATVARSFIPFPFFRDGAVRIHEEPPARITATRSTTTELHTYQRAGQLVFAGEDFVFADNLPIPFFWRNLVINPSGEQDFNRAWVGSNGTVETKIDWEV